MPPGFRSFILKSGNWFVDQGFQPDILLCLSYLFIISVTKWSLYVGWILATDFASK
jgi:hypothetical protein